MLELAAPLALLALPAPLVFAWLAGARPSDGAALAVPERIGASLLGAGRTGKGHRRIIGRQALLWATWTLLIVALAGPRSVTPVPTLKVTGRDLAIVLDLSGSMVREDFALDGAPVTRLAAVKEVGANFARRRAGDRVALIVFGSEAYYAAPFTFDTEAVARRIEEATIGISGRATNISDGLGLALKRMQDSAAATKVVILLSDGTNNAGATTPRGVAELAATHGVRIHTIALGPKDEITAQEGERGVVDAATLRAISQISGGESFRVRTTEDLIAVGAALDRLEATEADGLAAEIFNEYWPWPAALATCLCAALAWRET